MNRRGLLLFGVLCPAAVFFAGLTVYGAQAPVSTRSGSMFTTGRVARQVTIRTRQGQMLTVLNVPVGVHLSIHGRLTSGREPTVDVPVVFEGDVRIRTKPESQMLTGPALSLRRRSGQFGG